MNKSVDDRFLKTEDIEFMDAGILPVVDLLRKNGIGTFESCEGGPGHAFLEPTVRFLGDRGTGFKVYDILVTNGLDRPAKSIRRYWTASNGELEGPYWEVTFDPMVLRHVLKRRIMTRRELEAHAEATLSLV